MDKVGWNYIFNRRTAGSGHRCALVGPINRFVALGARLVAGIARCILLAARTPRRIGICLLRMT